MRTSRYHFYTLEMEPLSEVEVEVVADSEANSDQLIEEVFQYQTTREYPVGCEEGRKRVIRRKAKTFQVHSLDFQAYEAWNRG